MTTPPTTQSAITILKDAHQAILDFGHAKGGYYGGPGTQGFCLSGALRFAAGLGSIVTRLANPTHPVYVSVRNTGHDYATYEVAAAAVAALIPDKMRLGGAQAFTFLPGAHPETKIVAWNDFICDGGPEALLLLEQAREKLEAEL